MSIDVQSLTAQQKLDLAGVFGQIVIATGTISSPVAYFDVALPAGYKQFRLNIRGIRYDVDGDTMEIAVSSDGGTTFVCDTDNGDSYYEEGVFEAFGSLNHVHTTNPLMDINQGRQTPGHNPPHVLLLDIFPGSSSETFHLLYSTIAASGVTGGNHVYFEVGSQGLNPTATVPPTPARMNMMRILPFGNGDCQPPTSGDNISAGSWALMGVV